MWALATKREKLKLNSTKKPQNIRNFWIEGSIDGSKKLIELGPKSKDGGFYLEIKQRNKGFIIDACSINGYIFDDVITLEIKTPAGQTITVETKR